MTNSSPLPTLDIAIATHLPEGINRVAKMNLPHIDGVRYIISWQSHKDAPIPESLNRDDVEIYRFDQKGLSLNRNNALDNCQGDIILIADDDVTLYPESLNEIRIIARANPEVDLFTFRHDSASSIKYYPKVATTLHLPLPKNYYVCSIEIAFRRETNLRCHPLLGLGSPNLHAGEDEILLHSALKRGLNCRFFPLSICRHDHPTTGPSGKLSDKNLQGLGCVITLMHPGTAILRIPLKAWRTNRNRQAGFLRSLIQLSIGACRSLTLLRDKKYLW